MQLYEIAFLLKIPVYVLKNMPFEELSGWCEYFNINPPGWQDDRRTFTILQALGVKEKADKIFPTLKAGAKDDLNGLKGSALFKNMMNAVGGDKLAL